MFESAELGHEIDKERYAADEPRVRRALLAAQYELVELAAFPVVILIAGVDGAGKGDTLNLLNEWMDPRHIQTNAMRPVGTDLEGRPPMWRFWRALPPKGRTAIFVGSWYSQPLTDRAYRETSAAELDQQIAEIKRFEQMLTDEGTLLIKFWLHLSKDQQRKKFKRLEKDKQTAWRVSDTDWKHVKVYERFRSITHHVVRATSTAEAPWLVVEGHDARYRNLTVATSVLAALKQRIAAAKTAKAAEPAPPVAEVEIQPLSQVASIDGITVLDRLQLDQELDKETYRDQLETWQGRLNLAMRHKRFARLSVVAAFEGCDAAGKGGAIRRVTQALDARAYDVIPIAAPTDEERSRPYMWRFWRQVPARGRMAIFDRSWYGRVLVERVEKLCDVRDWTRAFNEVNDFEDDLVRNDTVVVKFWLQISKEEQLRRFEERAATPHKQHKITPEDWRNRERWDDYHRAVSEMFERTSTERAPWTLVEGNNKYFARLKVLRTMVEAIEAAL